jgi:phosphoribosyl 1,2-cyclic phosphate phosphodiesterase
MKITFLGTGTSVGIPSVGCECATCLSDDERDKRLRASILVEYDEHKIIVDTSTDFRYQALRVGLKQLDAVLFTHAHADHIFGLDDTRPLMFQQGTRLPVFATEVTWQGLRRVYSYAFQPSESGVPRIKPQVIEGAFHLFNRQVLPLTVMHGSLPVTAYRFEKFAYVTDCHFIPDETCEALCGLEVLVIDALRFKQHPTHMTVADALNYIDRMKPRRALLTHISHDIKHAELSVRLPDGVEIAYDGLEVELN